MKNCTDCKHAQWKRTAAGRLHPDGTGRCGYPWKMPALPACTHWIGRCEPKTFGGYISRKDELPTHCTYYARAEQAGKAAV